MIKKYKSIKEMQFEICDEDCYGTGEYDSIKIGELYERDTERDCFSDCELRLDKINGYGWLDCYKSDLEEFFIEVKEDDR